MQSEVRTLDEFGVVLKEHTYSSEQHLKSSVRLKVCLDCLQMHLARSVAYAFGEIDRQGPSSDIELFTRKRELLETVRDLQSRIVSEEAYSGGVQSALRGIIDSLRSLKQLHEPEDTEEESAQQSGTIDRKRVFFAQAGGHLDSLRVDSGTHGSESVDGGDHALMVLHTLKADAAAVGLTEVSVVAHWVEDALEVHNPGSKRGRRLVLSFVRWLSGYLAAVEQDMCPPVEAEEFLKLLTQEQKQLGKSGASLIGDTIATPGQPQVIIAEDRLLELRDLLGSQVEVAAAGGDLFQDFLIKATQCSDHLEQIVYPQFNELFGTITSLVLGTAHRSKKPASVEFSGGGVRLRRRVYQIVSTALTHLVKNAVVHGLERGDEREAAGKADVGVIQVEAEQKGEILQIEVIDDGAGLSAPCHELFERGVSGHHEVSLDAGRGMGLYIVQELVSSLGGEVRVESTQGKGTTFTLLLPHKPLREVTV